MRTRAEIRSELLRWFLYGVGISLIPFAFRVLYGRTHGHVPSYVELLSGGELVLISIGMAAAAVGDVLATRDRSPHATLVGFACILCVLLATYWYADIVTSRREGIDVDAAFVARFSVVVFLAALGVSGYCRMLALSELRGGQAHVE